MGQRDTEQQPHSWMSDTRIGLKEATVSQRQERCTMGRKRGFWMLIASIGQFGTATVWAGETPPPKVTLSQPAAENPSVLPPLTPMTGTPVQVLSGTGHSRLGSTGVSVVPDAPCATCGARGHEKHSRKDRCGIIPKGALPDPAGMKFKNLINTQAEIGSAGLLFFYDCEWEGDTDKLGRTAITRLARLTSRVRTSPIPVMIERTSDPVLDEKRRLAIVEHLVLVGVLDASERVQIGYPIDPGLEGLDAERLYYSLRLNPNTANGMGGRTGGGRLGMFSGFFGGGSVSGAGR